MRRWRPSSLPSYSPIWNACRVSLRRQSSKPVKPANKPNHFGVSVKLKLPERSRLQKRFAVTKPDGERPTLVAAAREAIK